MKSTNGFSLILTAFFALGCGHTPPSTTPAMPVEVPRDMVNNTDWNDADRSELKEELHRYILGHVRLAKFDNDSIMETCCEILIDENCPEAERDEFDDFGSHELDAMSKFHAQEQLTWPEQTDCDRLNLIEATLRESGILFWQVSPCCDSCTWSEVPYRIDEIDERYPGFRENVRGCAFFLDQTMPEMLADDTRITVYLSYGWIFGDGDDVPADVYKSKALEIAHEVSECLRANGFEIDWNESFSKKIGLTVDWKMRTTLE